MSGFSEVLYYEKKHAIIINDLPNNLYYYFDYDDRSYNINMDFQHFHSFYELHILLDSSANHIIEGVSYGLIPYDFVLLRPSLLHKTVYFGDQPSKRLIINFLYPDNYFGNQAAFKTILEPFSWPVPIFRFNKEHRLPLINLLNEIFTLSKQMISNEVKKLMFHQKFIEFLYAFWTVKDNNNYVNEKLESNMEKRISIITSYIHNHYQEDIGLDTLAKQFFISNYYLSHQFKKVTGRTLTSYIQMTRIRNAQYLLINTNEKIAGISEQCGFTSFSQFNRIFRKICGISPSGYKKEHTSVRLGFHNL